MASGKSQFVGTAGQYYLAYCLAARGMHASLTLGNAPSVDLIISSSDGKRSLAVQVKTATSAKKRKYGNVGYEWYVGSGAVGKNSPDFVYAFLDFKGDVVNNTPDVFFVPSLWVGKFVKPGWSMSLYFLPATETVEIMTKANWHILQELLSGSEQGLSWATTWPEEDLIKWGE